MSLCFPTHPASPQAEQDRIRLKNLLGEADHGLSDCGVPARERRRILEKARGLLDDPDFWRNRTEGLCLYLAADCFERCDLPFPCEELAVVSRRFHLKPLLPLLLHGAGFFLLALSRNRARFHRCDRYGIERQEVSGMPESLDETLAQEERQQQIQFHTGTGSASSGKRPSIVHGHGAGSDDDDDRLLRYLQRIDRALRPVLAEEGSPLVLACVDDLHAAYRRANSYPHLCEDFLRGNPDDLDEKVLHARALETLRPHFVKERAGVIERYRELQGRSDPRGTCDLRRILPAAQHAKVESLLVPLDAQVWGSYDIERDRVEIREARQTWDEDLLDLAAVQTLSHGGTVHALPRDGMPDRSMAAAVLRY